MRRRKVSQDKGRVVRSDDFNGSKKKQRSQGQRLGDPRRRRSGDSADLASQMRRVPIKMHSDFEAMRGMSAPDTAPKIRVVVRKRPLSRREKARSDPDVVEIASDRKTVLLHEAKTKVDLTRYVETHGFTFDNAYDEACDTQKIYTETCRPLVKAVFSGANATCFAYGQTGSGKTYTMIGSASGGKTARKEPGLYELAAKDIFAMAKDSPIAVQVCASFFEISGGKLFDLLNGRRRLRCLGRCQAEGTDRRPSGTACRRRR